jgi:hypothetical protein
VSSLPNESLVYRAISKESWFDANTGEIQPAAFELRFDQKTETWEKGISTDLEPEFSYRWREKGDDDEYKLKFSKCFGILEISVADIRDLGLDVDNDRDTHVNIIGFPDPDKESQKYDDILDNLITKARIYKLFEPPIKRPKNK